MGKVIFWLIVFFVVLFVLRMINAANSRKRQRERTDKAPQAPAAGAMTRCVECGVYLPSADAKPGPRGPLCGDPQCVHRQSGNG